MLALRLVVSGWTHCKKSSYDHTNTLLSLQDMASGTRRPVHIRLSFFSRPQQCPSRHELHKIPAALFQCLLAATPISNGGLQENFIVAEPEWDLGICHLVNSPESRRLTPAI